MSSGRYCLELKDMREPSSLWNEGAVVDEKAKETLMCEEVFSLGGGREGQLLGYES